MANVKSALEIALEKADKIGVLSPEEKDMMKDEGKITEILREFFLGKIDSNVLWQRFRGSKPALLRTAQLNLIDTLSVNSLPEDLQSKKKGILAIETLKEQPNTVVIESSLQALEVLKKEYEEMIAQTTDGPEKAYREQSSTESETDEGPGRKDDAGCGFSRRGCKGKA